MSNINSRFSLRVAGFATGDPVRTCSSTDDPLRYSPDAARMHFDLERTEYCWRDECSEVSDVNSETGLCESHKVELQNKWKK